MSEGSDFQIICDPIPEVIKLFSCSSYLSMNVIMLINFKIPTIRRLAFYHFLMFQSIDLYLAAVYIVCSLELSKNSVIISGSPMTQTCGNSLSF